MKMAIKLLDYHPCDQYSMKSGGARCNSPLSLPLTLPVPTPLLKRQRQQATATVHVQAATELRRASSGSAHQQPEQHHIL